MKTISKYVLIALVLVLPAMALALDFRSGENPSVTKKEKINNDVYMVGGSVNSVGEVNGDLPAFGGNVVINGEINGDVMSGGGNVSILADIDDDVRVGGGTIVIGGKIDGDLLAGGGQINIGGSGISGDVAVAGGNVRIDAPIKGNLFIAGGSVYINAPIEGNVRIQAETITLGSAAVLSGNLNYKAQKELIQEEGAVINGKIDFELTEKSRRAVSWALLSGLALWKFITLLVCSLLIGLGFRRYSKVLVDSALYKPVRGIGRGLITFISIPIISILLFVTMVGIPFGIAGIIGFVIFMIFTWIMTPIVLGNIMHKYFAKKEVGVSWKTILSGVVVYSLLGLIPFVGGIIQILFSLVTLGAMISIKIKMLKEWR